jgi:hypothetical protein
VESSGLAGLADSLADDLDRFLPDEDFLIPAEKAMLTRRGGRCDLDGQLLEFDPQSPHRHRCPACGSLYDRDEDHRWWIMGYQLWLSERAVHAALLARLRGAERHRRLAAAILTRYADRYLSYPNVDNVLGPGRVFFSTYLESIWLLQLCVALSLLDEGSVDTGAVRDRLVAPSAELIGLNNEGASNRQVWNSAALAAAVVSSGVRSSSNGRSPEPADSTRTSGQGCCPTVHGTRGRTTTSSPTAGSGTSLRSRRLPVTRCLTSWATGSIAPSRFHS